MTESGWLCEWGRARLSGAMDVFRMKEKCFRKAGPVHRRGGNKTRPELLSNGSCLLAPTKMRLIG